MDILRRKRRRDEAATSVDEASTMARVYGKHGIIRKMSQNTQIEAEDYDIHDSCVLRNFPKQKSSDLRFLAWVAYTRKFSDSSMTEVERRTCPLIWCRDVFPSEDAMLKHIYTCEHLSKGLYWCFRCQKTERVRRFRCKRCQGTPTTAERITTVAKKIFMGLGVRRAGGDHSDPTTSKKVNLPKDPDCPSYPPPPKKCVQLQEMVEDNEECDLMELPNTGISEMAANPIFELSAGWTTQSQELPDSSLAEMTGSEFAPISPLAYPDEKLHHDSFNLSMCNAAPALTHAASPRRPSQPISLRLDTCVAEPLRQHCPRPDMSATVLSPLSPSDRIQTGFFTVSPTDTVVSSQSMFGNSECSSATTLSTWDESCNSLGWGKGASEIKSSAASLGRFPSNASDKLSRNGSILSNTPQLLPVALPYTLERHSSSSSTSSAAHLANRCTMSEKRQTISGHWSSEKDLVKSLSEVLQEHIEHSRQALRKLPPNSDTIELLALSTNSIRSIGFEVLERLLEGRNPSSLVQVFAFTNVAYSMAVAVDRVASKVQTEQWFQHCLSWSTFLPSEGDQRRYERIACAIWQPQAAANSQPSSFLLHSMERENKLIAACKHFLDLLQCLGNHENSNLTTKARFDFARSWFVQKAKTSIIDQLIQKPSIEAFIEDVVNVENRLKNNFISDVRQLELELICTAKLASQSDTAYGRFTNHVTDLCDAMYAEEGCTKSRTAYHIETVGLAYQLLPMVEYTNNEYEMPEYEMPEYEMPQYNIDFQINGHDLAHDYALEGIETPVDNFSKDVDAILNESFDFSQFEFMSQTTLLDANSCLLQTAISSDVSALPAPSSTDAVGTHSPLPTATKYRCHCGYVPTGEERWKASNLSRHKRIQHPENGGKVYKCEWEGCGSTFTRSDNLKEHVRKKGHQLWDVERERKTGDGESKRKRRRKEMRDEMDTALR